MAKAAILVDGGFFRKRAPQFWKVDDPEKAADNLVKYCMKHLTPYVKNGDPHNKNIKYVNQEHAFRELYRIFYYDCAPATKKVYHPLLNRTVDLSKTDIHKWTTTFIEKLREKRKVALRLGQLAEEQAYYTLKQDAVKRLCQKKITINDLEEEDFYLSITQKGVDIKIGTDIASLAYKKQIDKIILIAGDSDFVPAAKLARREGIDFVLDPLHAPIRPDLFEHIDGLRTCIGKPQKLNE